MATKRLKKSIQNEETREVQCEPNFPEDEPNTVKEDEHYNSFNFFDPIPVGESDEVIAEWWRCFIGHFLGLEIPEFDVNEQTEEYEEEEVD